MTRRRIRDEASSNWSTKVDRLRELLVSAELFDEINDFFHTQLVSDATFREAGELEQNAEVKALVETALRSLAPDVALGELVLVHLASHGMWHGFALCGVGLSTIFYFEELGMGLFCYVPSVADSQIHYLRLTRVAPRGLTLPPLCGSPARGQA